MSNPFENDPGVARLAKLQGVADAFVNTITGVGTARSRLSYGEYVAQDPIPDSTISVLLQTNDLARKIVDQPVDWALGCPHLEREAAEQDPEKDHEDSEKVLAAVKRLLTDWKGQDRFRRGACAARAYGGGGLLLGGAGSFETPVDPEDESGLKWILDWDRRDMTPVEWAADGSPVMFQYRRPGGRGPGAKDFKVHVSRLVLFPGAPLYGLDAEERQGWDASVLEPVLNVLKGFDQAWSSVDAMFNDASQSVFKLSGLIKALAEAEGETAQAVKTRLQMLDLTRSATKAVVLDAGTPDGTYPEESYSVVERMTIGQIDKPLVQYFIRLAAAAGRPATVLFGVSPQGMNATGESDMLLWQNEVDRYRHMYITPAFERVVNAVARTIGVPGPWCVKWPQVVVPKALDVATQERMRTETLAILVDKGVILPEEAALSLPHMAPSAHFEVDYEARRKMLPDALKSLEDGTDGADMQAGLVPLPRASERKTPTEAAGTQFQGAG